MVGLCVFVSEMNIDIPHNKLPVVAHTAKDLWKFTFGNLYVQLNR